MPYNITNSVEKSEALQKAVMLLRTHLLWTYSVITQNCLTAGNIEQHKHRSVKIMSISKQLTPMIPNLRVHCWKTCKYNSNRKVTQIS